MMVEGVHSGSAGPIFYSADVLRDSADKWQGIPVVLNHPMKDNRPVSINHSEEIFSEFAIGYVAEAFFDEQNRALKGTIKIPANTPAAMQVQQTKEVSVGVYNEEIFEAGSFHGQDYIARATGMNPDHLAILTELQGACSWSDGCGIRANTFTKEDVGLAIYKAIIEKDKTMSTNDNPMPTEPGSHTVTTGANDEKTYTENQRYADENGILLPISLNANPNHKKQQDGDKSDNPMLPII
jgi:hypothetical protein